MDPFNEADFEQLAARGIAPAEAERQIATLRNPPPAIVLDRPCTVGDGIARIGEGAQADLAEDGRRAASAGRVMKFVPASGAATRMFKDLIPLASGSARPSETAAGREFLSSLDSFAFAGELRRVAGVAGTPKDEGEERALIRTMLETMEYARKPKGLIAFHRRSTVRTAFEEHLLEGTRYARAESGRVKMHFTVAPEFRTEFVAALTKQGPAIEAARSARLDVEFSEQHPSTDTLAVDADGNPFRTGDGALLFRPGGHGALLVNLGETAGDVVSIKNIDNILPDEANDEAVRWKLVLIGHLARLQREVFETLEACESDDGTLDAAIDFAAARFNRRPAKSPGTIEAKRQFVREALERPLRVVGVVKNEGEPGGAPFWVRHPDGSRSIQIVESAQVDAANDAQAAIFASSTHFNPVDIVCGLRSRTGEPFDLTRFVDSSAVFLSRKSHEGRPLTALERPGLWNGAMAWWNTACVEVPGSTFAPVKTVFDLLREEHR